ncbi:hypothetical protein OHB11_38575 [Streptomyces zaomyceticus]|uniref:DUF1775 domain-containing protein n=1 Tax=Streptomyces zaomyceticus TaxID=68286 RepID=A0ABZ1LLU9_9ACTN|nr:hypothetical protein OG237_01265 [Streptomyces zaomyceticus]
MHTAIRPALVLATALVLGPALPQPAAAHGHNLEVVITGHRNGHVLTTVTWENDGDAVDEQVAALVSAVSADGRRSAGPWKLVRGARPTDWTTAEALPTGIWKVTVAAGQPALGHAERQLTVAAVPSSPASSVPSGTAATPAPTPPGSRETSPAPETSPSTSRSAAQHEDENEQTWGPWLTTVGLAVASLAGAAAGIWIRRRRAGRR